MYDSINYRFNIRNLSYLFYLYGPEIYREAKVPVQAFELRGQTVREALAEQGIEISENPVITCIGHSGPIDLRI